LKKIVFSKDNLALEFYEATKKLTNIKNSSLNCSSVVTCNIGTVLSTDKPSLEITLRALLLKKYFLQAREKS